MFFDHLKFCFEVLGTHDRGVAAVQLRPELHRVEDGHGPADGLVQVGDRVEGIASVLVGHETKPAVWIHLIPILKLQTNMSIMNICNKGFVMKSIGSQ